LKKRERIHPFPFPFSREPFLDWSAELFLPSVGGKAGFKQTAALLGKRSSAVTSTKFARVPGLA